MDMKAEIQKKLEEIERTENVRIIHCIESGSRARGYSVADSDYDVRFVYVRPVEYYLKLESKKDVIEWQLDDTFDISGWDIQKYLRLTYASNLSVYEWAASKVVYSTTEHWGDICLILPEFFNPKPVIHSLLAAAETHSKKSFAEDEVKIKKYIYAILPLMQSRYILEKGVPMPISITELIKCVTDPAAANFAQRLLRERQSCETTARIDELNSYIETGIREIRSAADVLPVFERPDRERLDKCFVDTLKNVWGKLL